MVSIAGANVTLRGFAITGSGESHDAIDAGILVEGSGHLVENNRIEDVLFGIHLRQTRNTTARNNSVTGKPL
ncbi:MAG TPA: right-handed parallel beta-helix repeat-containing protein, partial [Spirochaetota bacterium]|nr:right-handed parallel beta-helix repeat-containing protein [Spirochaetota bacterium]